MKKFLTCAFIVLVLCFTGCSSSSFDWNEIYLNDMLPAPESNKGEINFNTESELMLSVTGISEAQYNEYKQACQGKGFIIDSEETLTSYKAYNNDGYILDLFYHDSAEELTIQLQEPIIMGELKWPTQGVASSFPVPESTVGKIEWEHSDSFLIYVGEMSIEDYNTYVSKCIDAGFDINYDKGDTYYRAENAEGYNLSLKYEGFNIVFIRVDEPDRISSETSDIEDSSMSSESEELTEEVKTEIEKFAQENGISVELAQALSQTEVPPSLNKLNEWEQIEDYAEGQRYTGNIYSNVQDKYYYMVFYVKDDRVESIRDQRNGLEFLYQRMN